MGKANGWETVQETQRVFKQRKEASVDMDRWGQYPKEAADEQGRARDGCIRDRDSA